MKAYFIIYIILVLAAFLLGWYNYNKKTKSMRFLIALLGYTVIFSLVSYWVAVVYRNNLALEHLYNFVSVGLYAMFYYEIMNKNMVGKIFLYVGLAIMAFSIFNVIWLEPLNSYPAYVYTIKTIYLFAGGCVMLLQFLDLPSKERLFKTPTFLIALSIVWFNSVSSLFFFITPLLVRYKINTTFISHIHFNSNFIHYGLFLLAMYYLKKYKNNVGIISN